MFSLSGIVPSRVPKREILEAECLSCYGLLRVRFSRSASEDVEAECFGLEQRRSVRVDKKVLLRNQMKMPQDVSKVEFYSLGKSFVVSSRLQDKSFLMTKPESSFGLGLSLETPSNAFPIGDQVDKRLSTINGFLSSAISPERLSQTTERLWISKGILLEKLSPERMSNVVLKLLRMFSAVPEQDSSSNSNSPSGR